MADSKKPHSLHGSRLQRYRPHLSCSSTFPLADRRTAFTGSPQWGVDGLLPSVSLPLSLTWSPLPPPPSQTSASPQSLQAPPADASVARAAAARPMAAAATAAPAAAAVTAQAGSMAVKG